MESKCRFLNLRIHLCGGNYLLSWHFKCFCRLQFLEDKLKDQFLKEDFNLFTKTMDSTVISLIWLFIFTELNKNGGLELHLLTIQDRSLSDWISLLWFFASAFFIRDIITQQPKIRGIEEMLFRIFSGDATFILKCLVLILKSGLTAGWEWLCGLL